jgi:hypothetical protein
MSAAIEVIEVRRVGCNGMFASARVRFGCVIIDGVTITRWPPDTGVARVHLPAIQPEDDSAIVEIADPQVNAALDRELLIAAHLLEPEEVVP